MKTSLMVLAALLVAFCLFAAFLHHHDDSAEHDCPVCRLVQSITGIFILALAAILFAAFRIQKRLSIFEGRLSSLLLASSLKDRSPPASSF